MRLRQIATLLCAPAAMLAASAASADCNIKSLGELPVTMTELQATVPVKVNGRDSRFSLDSGYYFSRISQEAARAWQLPPVDQRGFINATTISGEPRSISAVRVKSFAMAGIDLGQSDFIVTSGAMDGEGTIGQNILAVADVEYDLPGGAVRLMKPEGCTNTNYAYWAGDKPYAILDIEPRNPEKPEIVATVLVNGVKLRAMFDTGYSSSLISIPAAARAGIKPGDPGVTPLPDEDGMKRWAAPVASLSLGDESLRQTHIRIGQMRVGDFDMLIGNDFFRVHRIYIANSSHRMFFTYAGGLMFNVSGRVSAPPLLLSPSTSDSSGPASRHSSGY
jgi:predicted aspartyl protease